MPSGRFKRAVSSSNLNDVVTPVRRDPLYWETILFLVVSHLGGIAGILYAALVAFSWWSLGLAAVWFGLSMISTTGGYHRLFSHRAYRCNGALRLFYLLFGAGSFQGPALRWASDHRNHHARSEERRVGKEGRG